MGELSLVLFTVLSQMAAGATVTLWLLDVYGGRIDQQVGMFVTRAIIAAAGLGLLASFAHLGHPFEAYRALSHLSNSWLSREAALYGLFLVLLVLYWRQWFNGDARNGMGALVATVGILTVIASGLIYVLPAQPVWNNFSPILFFLITTGVLGPLFVAVLLKSKNYIAGKSVYYFAAGGLACGGFCFLLYLSLLTGVGGIAAGAGSNLFYNAALWPRVLIGWVVPLGLIAYAATRAEWDIRAYVIPVFTLVLVGEVLGRVLFYASAVSLLTPGM